MSIEHVVVEVPPSLAGNRLRLWRVTRPGGTVAADVFTGPEDAERVRKVLSGAPVVHPFAQLLVNADTANRVHQAMDDRAKTRTSLDNVMDVLAAMAVQS